MFGGSATKHGAVNLSSPDFLKKSGEERLYAKK
jgi:hypothetical protein